MKVLLTGAFGNLGSLVLETLLQQGHDVTCFDIKSPLNEKTAKPYLDKATIQWGDIRDENLINQLVKDQDAIIHLAAIIAPFSELNPELAKAVNIDGTLSLLKAAEQSEKKPVLVFSSSCSVYGYTQDKTPPLKVSEPLAPMDNYSSHKIECEKNIRESEANWIILRIGGMVDSRMRHSDKEQMKLAFQIAADTRIEFIHPKDAATAFVNAISSQESIGKVMNLGGGKSCQVSHLDFVNVMSSAMGLTFPKSYFGDKPFYTDWMDTEESQRLLNYQNHSFEDLRQEAFQRFKFIRWISKPFSPITVRLVPLFVR